MFSLEKWLYGSASNVLRLLMSMMTAVFLPPLLTRHLSQAEYSAWVLILQLSAYVALLDGGLQTVTAKLVAEHHARNDVDAGHRVLSNSISVLTLVACVGIVLVTALTWLVPYLFHDMPPALVSQVRSSLFLIGCSAAFALPFNPFAAVFTGLQEYGFPSIVVLVSKLSAFALLAGMILAGKSLVMLAATMAAVNVVTALTQWFGWRRYAGSRVGWTPFLMDRKTSGELLRSGGILALWTLGGLLVSGLDIMIVGRYDFANTGFYSAGANATNFMVMCVNGLFAPLLPAVSSMQAHNNAKAVGDLTIRATRFCTVLLCAISLPLVVFAFPLLSLWVGRSYAEHSVSFLRLLVLGNLIRQLGLAYSTVVIATGRQHLASIATMVEAIVNVTVSLVLVRYIGASGVAYGTLVGAVVSIVLHLMISMRATRLAIDLSPARFVMEGLLRPLICLLPAALLLPFLRNHKTLPAPVPMLLACFAGVIFLLWSFGLTSDDRSKLSNRLARHRGVAHA